MSQALRKLTGAVAKSKTCLIFINQLREKIGVMFGNPETTTGGRALKFYLVGASRHPPHCEKVSRTATGGRTRVKGGEEQGGAAPARRSSTSWEARRHLTHRRPARISASKTHRRKRAVRGSRAAASVSGQGRENAKQFLKDNPQVFKAIEARAQGIGHGTRYRIGHKARFELAPAVSGGRTYSIRERRRMVLTKSELIEKPAERSPHPSAPHHQD